MGLSRLENFIKNINGSTLYVDPNNLDATDGIENQGNSPTRPFKTLQRAIIEAVRFSYITGLDNDRFEHTKISLSSGIHYVDNRPGIIPDWDVGDPVNYIYRNLSNDANFGALNSASNFDINDPQNILYKFNSVHGGVIIPRGVSIVGDDLKKTRIRPLYVPYPYEIQGEESIEPSAIFNITGGSYFKAFTVLDADSRKFCYYDYDNSLALPRFSHHKLTAFEYVDGVNPVTISYGGSDFSTDRTDLEIYYQKIGLAFGTETNRPISPDYPSTLVDLQPRIDEYRIVGSRGKEVGITTIYAGDGVTSSTTVTVVLSETTDQIDVDTPIQIQGISGLDQFSKYNGQFLVSDVISDSEIQYKVENAPANPLPDTSQLAGATLNIITDTVTSASPYVSEVSLRSVYGMSGLHADGSRVEGFKSVVVDRFTGISLQKDDNAFVVYNPQNGAFEDNTTVSNLYSNSRAVYKENYKNSHIKVSNGAYSQVVSIFAIGYAQHFVTENGGDISVENSSSNFGARSLVATGFNASAFDRDDVGYLTHIISPKEIDDDTTTVEFTAIDIAKTNSVLNANRLYLLGETNSGIIPESTIEGYRIGAKENDSLNVYLENQKYSARIIMDGSAEISAKKSYKVKKKPNGISNEIVSNVIELTSAHDFLNGETVRVISDTGELPDGLNANQLYYVITSGSGDPVLSSTKIKLAQSLNDANSPYTSNPEIDLYSNETADLHIISRVSDKKSGDIGHPVQYDATEGNWYITVETGNAITSAILPSVLNATSRTYVERQQDTRNISDTIYRFRYVIPKDANINARPPLDGFILQESGNVVGSLAEIGKYYTISPSTLSNNTDIRNPRFIADAIWSSSGIATFTSELPHQTNVGTKIEITNIISSSNLSATDNRGYNGTFTITSTPSEKEFTVQLATNPGTFDLAQVINRGTSLPNFRKVELTSTQVVYRSQEVQPYIRNQQDGIYHLILVNSSYSPKDTNFSDLKFQQPIQNLYPQTNRDNPTSDPKATACYALPEPLGHVVVNDPEKSITKETLFKNLNDFGVGIGITNIISSSGIAHTIFTEIDHGLNRVTELQITSAGAGYGSGSSGLIYNAVLSGSGTGKGATAVISVNGVGNVVDIRVMNGGSSYAIGNVLSIVGVATTVGFSTATATVTRIYDNVGDSINLENVRNGFEPYNGQYRITGITTSDSRRIIVSSASSVSSFSTTGIGASVTRDAILNLSGRALTATIQYNNVSGIGTITTGQTHGLHLNKKITIGGANSDFYNGSFIIKNILDLTRFEVNFGTNTVIPATTGSIYVYPNLFNSNGGNITKSNENISGRLIPFYDNVRSSLTAAVSSTTASTISVNNAIYLGLEVGDYLQINDEIFRIRVSVSSDVIQVYRGLLGTSRSTHVSGSIVTRIHPKPIEFRRNSITKASAHKFEHVGFGPGNYSTALPEKQDRKLSEVEEILSHKTSVNGGLIVFSGMNDSGDYYIGNKKVNSATGEEKDIDSPVPSTTGEELDIGGLDVGFDVITPLEVSISRSINVEGGNDRSIISKFNGPVIFNSKLTSNSDKGIETKSIYLQGDVDISRKHTVGISTPIYPGNYGDIVYDANPIGGGNVGWVYTLANKWEQFGSISNDNVVFSNTVGVSVNGTPLGASSNINLIGTGAATLSGSYAGGTSTITINVVSGAGVFSNLVTTGISTFVLISNFNNGIRVVSGLSTFNGPVSANSGLSVSGILTAQSLSVTSGITAQSVNVTGISTFGNTLNVSGDVLSSGFGVFVTPNSGTTNGGVVIRANAITSKNYLQFTNNARTTQWGVVEVNSSGDFIWSGKLQSPSLQVTSITSGNITSSGIITASSVVSSGPVTGTTITASSFVGPGVIPIGGIIMWSGSIASIPTGWALCTGSSGTPDLRERFIVGAGGDNPTVSGTSGYAVGATGGENTVTLSEAQMPAHSHTDTYNVTTAVKSAISAIPGLFPVAVDVDETPTSTTTNTVGSSSAHENRPPYYALAFIMRVA